MRDGLEDTGALAGADIVGGRVFEVPDHDTINAINTARLEDAQDIALHDGKKEAVEEGDLSTGGAIPYEETISSELDEKNLNDDTIIVTGADAANHLLSIRDDHDEAITFRSLLLASALTAFQAVMSQIYNWKPTSATISGTFITLIAYFTGRAWGQLLPRGDLLKARWRSHHPDARVPLWIHVLNFLNPQPFGLKEHAIIVITALAGSNASASSTVYSAQKLFYNIPLTATNVVLTTVSIGLLGYGLAGLFRSVTIWQVEAVYWGNLPTVKVLQGLHWQEFKDSKPIRYFWYAFSSMTIYEFIPAYMFPWLNSVSVPCLASMHATGNTANTLTNLFGGSYNNEGLGLFEFSFDWQYITSANTSLPLKWQAHAAAGYIVCYLAMIGIYYNNTWNSKSLPFMSTLLRTADGGRYPTSTVFPNGVLDESALEQNGIPRLAGSYAYALMIGNAAIGALIVHIILFWGKDTVRAIKNAFKNKFDDRHHIYMAANYREVPWYWYAGTLIIAFIFGIIVVVKHDVDMPVWAFIVSLILGIVIAPFSTILYSRFGNGIATNNLSKMIAGLALPGRPVGNMYFAAFSHSVIANCLNLSQDLKMGEYLKIPPMTMFATQVYGTILGGFINYVIMVRIIDENAATLISTNGSNSWSGASIQSYNTNATSWALAKYLYTAGREYYMVPVGLAIGAAAVIVHWLIYKIKPTIRGLNLVEINMPQFLLYSSFIPYNANQTCVIWSQVAAGLIVQYWIRNYRANWFKNYMYLVTGAWDGGSLVALFILSLAVFGVAGPQKPFPLWWGNNQNGNLDLCPTGD